MRQLMTSKLNQKSLLKETLLWYPFQQHQQPLLIQGLGGFHPWLNKVGKFASLIAFFHSRLRWSDDGTNRYTNGYLSTVKHHLSIMLKTIEKQKGKPIENPISWKYTRIMYVTMNLPVDTTNPINAFQKLKEIFSCVFLLKDFLNFSLWGCRFKIAMYSGAQELFL